MRCQGGSSRLALYYHDTKLTTQTRSDPAHPSRPATASFYRAVLGPAKPAGAAINRHDSKPEDDHQMQSAWDGCSLTGPPVRIIQASKVKSRSWEPCRADKVTAKLRSTGVGVQRHGDQKGNV
jgi:hypothetical protein